MALGRLVAKTNRDLKLRYLMCKKALYFIYLMKLCGLKLILFLINSICNFKSHGILELRRCGYDFKGLNRARYGVQAIMK